MSGIPREHLEIAVDEAVCEQIKHKFGVLSAELLGGDPLRASRAFEEGIVTTLKARDVAVQIIRKSVAGDAMQ
jgi:hypothetical protein